MDASGDGLVGKPKTEQYPTRPVGSAVRFAKQKEPCCAASSAPGRPSLLKRGQMSLLLRLAPISARRRGSSEAIEAIAAGGVGGSACAVIVEVLGVRGRQHLSSGALRAFPCALISLAGAELSEGGMGWWCAGSRTGFRGGREMPCTPSRFLQSTSLRPQAPPNLRRIASWHPVGPRRSAADRIGARRAKVPKCYANNAQCAMSVR